MLPLPFAVGLLAGAAAIKLWRNGAPRRPADSGIETLVTTTPAEPASKLATTPAKRSRRAATTKPASAAKPRKAPRKSTASSETAT